MQSMYAIGDRVVCVSPFDDNDEIVGLVGTVCGPIFHDFCGVRYDDEFMRGHSCRGNCEDHHGWETSYECLEPYVEPEAVITMTYEELEI